MPCHEAAVPPLLCCEVRLQGTPQKAAQNAWAAMPRDGGVGCSCTQVLVLTFVPLALLPACTLLPFWVQLSLMCAQ